MPASVHRQIASLAAAAAARLELEQSLGAGPLRLSPEALAVAPAEIPPHITPYQPPRPVPPPAQAAPTQSANAAQQAESAGKPAASTIDFRQSPAPSGVPATPRPPQEPVEQVQPLQTGGAEKLAAIKPLCDRALSCQDCVLCEQRRQVVFGEGSLDARVVFIGEAPGRAEDIEGRPFVGPDGALLTEIIEKGMRLSRDEVYLTGIVKCRPPGSRDLHEQEIAACLPYLREQLAIIKPEAIVAVGGRAAGILTGEDCGIDQMRGNWYEFAGIPLLPVYHTSFLLRQRRLNGGQRTRFDRLLWEDIKLVMRKLGMQI